MSDSHKKGHDYHLVDPSVWPITISFSAMILAFGTVYYMHAKSFWLLLIGLALTLYSSLCGLETLLLKANIKAHTGCSNWSQIWNDTFYNI
jgi:cytochrome c oxidase subunit III